MVKQCIIRVFPHGWKNPTINLQQHLDNGWRVVMVTVIIDESGNQVADYILEKTFDS